MRLKLDENLSRHLKPILSHLKHDVTTAQEEGVLSQPDTVVAARAKAEGRMLFTLDLDFGNLTKYAPGTHPGIILFRPVSFGPTSVNRMVEAWVRTSDLDSLAGCVVVVEPQRMRIRRGPRSE
jgi:predicted nuclease of predicted toxin-antitoxin system